MKLNRLSKSPDAICLTMNSFEAEIYAMALLKVSEIYLDEYFADKTNAPEIEKLNRNHGYCKNAAHFIGRFLADKADSAQEIDHELEDPK